MEIGHWKTGQVIPPDFFGFVYLVTCKTTGRKYIGRKQRLIRRGKKFTDSEWQLYTGSCKELNADIAERGKDTFLFEIIRFCSNKRELAYYEAYEQFISGALLREDYYNKLIMIRSIGKLLK